MRDFIKRLHLIKGESRENLYIDKIILDIMLASAEEIFGNMKYPHNLNKLVIFLRERLRNEELISRFKDALIKNYIRVISSKKMPTF